MVGQLKKEVAARGAAPAILPFGVHAGHLRRIGVGVGRRRNTQHAHAQIALTCIRFIV